LSNTFEDSSQLDSNFYLNTLTSAVYLMKTLKIKPWKRTTRKLIRNIKGWLSSRNSY